ncbi:TMEM165/GDT1 family protein [Pseudonocardia parietis]|uniref:Ca2+/H+ antiporter (TMEM165/GDT1 family)/protein-S-isoprenylcysteine O-methyltransferase Ste14 n=1 Tax=Pseudonocardia parietis TaxID=570936 RepID=A0ABS4W2S1_9PSEU|nr:TMEM165/GDT1 family protein [Pseudonocardia parietis]MBP2370500.1 putative Ca2+/H+ antiporter (TMEM165/GDT1 family)/protein-S-isoprenylcysteine O-methyltransferase Ste14 [Pseudonocardia parietis]
MDGFLVAFAVSLGVVFVAELGDKSQLMALTFATRFKALPVLVGITIAAAVTHLVSVAVGYGLGTSLPTGWITLVAALAFIGFGLWSLRGDADGDADGQRPPRPRSGSAVVTVTMAFFLAELGDKTMLATVALASQYHWVGVWLGSTAGMVAASGLAILVGRTLGRRLPERMIEIGGAVLFLGFGAVMLVDAILELGGPGTGEAVLAAMDHRVTGWAALVLGAIATGVVLGTRVWARGARGGRRLEFARAPGSPAWWARMSFAAGAVLGLVAPLLVGLGVLGPISVLARPVVALVGAGLLLVGFGVLVTATRQFGAVLRESAQAGAPVADDPDAARRPVLATGGLYRRVRHPGMTGLVVGYGGMLLMAPTLLGLLAGVLILVAVQIRARGVYEPGLGSALGPEYDAYRRRTGRFLPRVRDRRSTAGV